MTIYDWEKLPLKEKILLTVDDLVADFLYYNRKEDEYLPVDSIERAIYEGEITLKEITDRFAHGVTEAVIVDH